MTTYIPPKKNTEYIFYLGLVSQSTGQFQSNPTLAAGDVKVSKDGGALANLTTLPAVTPASSKMVKATISSTEMNADNITLVFSDAAGAEWDDVIINIQTSVNQIDDIIADTNDIQARLPAALSGDGFMKSDLKSIEDELTSGNNATLNLKRLNIINNVAPNAVQIQSTHAGGSNAIDISSVSGIGITILGSGYGVTIDGDPTEGTGLGIEAAHGIEIVGNVGNAVFLSSTGSGKSISALQGIIGSDSEDLSVTNITDKIWDEATAGHTTAGTTGKALTDAGSAGDPWGTALPGAYGVGTAGKIIGDNVNATISSRSSHSAADVWAVATRTLTAISDSAGITTLLSRIASALNISSGKVEANIKQINDTSVTGDGSGTPWGPA